MLSWWCRKARTWWKYWALSLQSPFYWANEERLQINAYTMREEIFLKGGRIVLCSGGNCVLYTLECEHVCYNALAHLACNMMKQVPKIFNSVSQTYVIRTKGVSIVLWADQTVQSYFLSDISTYVWTQWSSCYCKSIHIENTISFAHFVPSVVLKTSKCYARPSSAFFRNA